MNSLSDLEIRQFLASVPRGFGDLLADELRAFGAMDVRERGNSVAFTGTLQVAYQACLESRVASRIYLELLRFEAIDDAEIYARLREIDWSLHIDPAGTIACEWSGRHPAITNTHFGSLRLKDAICDSLRERCGQRPSIAVSEPEVSLHAHAVGEKVTVSLDLSGEGLHRRGWRADTGEAPLRENIAAGILVRAGWPKMALEGGGFLDPMCGSGSFVIEAARMAAGYAANHGRRYFGFLRWRGHDAALWQQLLETSRVRAEQGLQQIKDQGLRLRGFDIDRRVIHEARLNASYAGVSEITEFAVRPLAETAPPEGVTTGLLCTNPPWGRRLGDDHGARVIYAELGRILRERFGGWQAAVLAGDAAHGLELGLRANRVHAIAIGALDARLLRIKVDREAERDLRPKAGLQIDQQLAQSAGGLMFGNRLRKNLKQLSAWLRRENVGCYRLYDADMPEYAFAIDVYTAVDSAERWLVVQEYQAPAEIPEDAVRRRRSEALAALQVVLDVPSDHIHLKTRRRSKRGEQYVKRDERAEFHVVGESGLKFQVNFVDYLDTGLFLDHRITRQRLRDLAAGRRFLNLFACTGSATVYAAAGGARSTTTVDLSATYLDWCRRNLEINGFGGPQHRGIQADVRQWLHAAAQHGERYDLIFCDPPTFSNSKRMEGVLDTQRDHVELIEAAMALLSAEGVLVFSTNAQRFKLEPMLLERYQIVDISRQTLPPDYQRNPHIHYCYELRQAPAATATAGRRTISLSR